MEPNLHIFRSQIGMFDPFALPEHNVCINYQGAKIYRLVNFMEAIPPFQCLNIGAVGAGLRSAKTQVPNLQMYDEEFGLFRWYVIDNAQIYLYHPFGVSKNQLRNLQVPYDHKVLQSDPNLVSSEIVVWQINNPGMEAYNGQAYPLAAVRIIAMGYRFHSIGLPATAAQAIGDKKGLPTVEDILNGKEPVLQVYASGFGHT